jgi:site-specific recombinase XerD
MKVKALLRLDKPLSNDTFPIWIRITANRKSRYISLGYSCQEEEWDSSNSRLWEVKPRITEKEKERLNINELKDLKESYSVIKINSLAKRINAELDKKIRSILSTKDNLEATNKDLSSKNIKLVLTSKKVTTDKSFIEYWKEQNKHIEKTASFSTFKNYKSSLNILSSFRKDKDILFEDINHKFLEEYQVFLIEKGNKTDTIHKVIRNLRTILFKAIKDTSVEFDKNPFFTFKLKLEKNKKKERLSIEEIKALQSLDIPNDQRIWHTRNMFLFSFFNAGIRIGDLLQIKWENLSNEGRLEYVMNKNGKVRTLKLNKEALAILKPYKNMKGSKKGFIFPFLRNDLNSSNKPFYRKQIESNTTLINKDLKDLAKMANIKKNVTSHIARHSFADIARKKNVSIYDIQGLLAHSSPETTRKYLDEFDIENQDKAHEAVFEGF